MGSYTVKVQFRCHSSGGGEYLCCDQMGFSCLFPLISFCQANCSRSAVGEVTVFITDFYNNETQLGIPHPFAIDNDQVYSFDPIGVLNWPDGSFQ